MRSLAAQASPLHRNTETWLKDAGVAYNGVAKPDKATPAYDVLVKSFRFSPYWRDYVHTAAATLDNQSKLDEAVKVVVEAAKSLGNGPQAADLEAFQARRLERQEKWADAATEMLRILGTNASNPLYRPLAGEAYRFLVVADQKDAEVKFLEGLAARYEGWDEGDRIRISLSTTYARDKKAAQAVKLLEEVAGRHQAYEIGACGHDMIRYLSKYSRGLFGGTVGVHPVQRVADDMSGPDYYLPQVPYTMYFYKGYAIHGTYWHNNFGHPMSHGCVNMRTDDAAWLFNWASIGTPVVTHW